jgi:hypothetical protein
MSVLYSGQVRFTVQRELDITIHVGDHTISGGPHQQQDGVHVGASFVMQLLEGILKAYTCIRAFTACDVFSHDSQQLVLLL